MPNRRSASRAMLASVTLACVLLAFLAQGCVLAVVPLISAMSGDKQTATVEIPKAPIEVYTAALQLAKANPELTITKEDPLEKEIAVTRDKQKASIKAIELPNNHTQLLITADSAQNEDEDQKMALRVAQRICDKLGVRYTVVQ